MTLAVEAQGTVISIGQGDARSVAGGADTFDVIGEVKSWDGPNGSASEINTTHLSSTANEILIGLRDEGSVSLSLNRVFGDAGQESARTARADRELRNLKMAYSDGTVGSFTAYVMEFSTSGGVDAIVEGSVTLRISGPYTEA